jgi:RNA polymerase sigma-70 factor (ECF subfamily)
MGPTDEELVAAFQSGDLSAFDALQLRWDRKIQGAIYRILGSEDEARDLCQETFLKAYRALRRFKGEARFSSWLYQIALNLCRDRMRRRKGRTLVSLEEMAPDAQPAPRSWQPSALELAEGRDLARRVAFAVASLPEEQREVIVLKEYQGLTFLEIAEVLGMPPSTVKTRLYRGLSQLRERLEEQGIHAAAPVPASYGAP